MIRRLAAAIVTGILGAFLTIAPAEASVIYGCSNNVQGQLGQVCLYNWIDFNQGGGWHVFSFDYLNNYSCTNLVNHTWNTGGDMNDSASSLVINGYPQSTGGTRVWFYNWVNCNNGGGYAVYWIKQGDSLRLTPNLGSMEDFYFTSQSNWYDRWTSVRVETLIP